MSAADPTIDLRDYLKVLRSRRWTVIVATMLGVAVAAAFIFMTTPLYEAQAEVLVLPLTNSFASSASAIQALAPDMNTEKEVVASSAVADIAQRTIGGTTSAQDLLQHLSVDVVLDSDVMQIGYSDPDPNRAALLANAFAQAYLQYRKDILVGQLEPALHSIQADIDRASAALSRVRTESATGQGLTEAQREQLKIDELRYSTSLTADGSKLADIQSMIDASTGGQMVQAAVPPTRPSSPHIYLDIAVGFVVGLIAGVVLAFLRESLDARVREPEELERRLGVPVAGSVPPNQFDHGRRHSLAALEEPRGSVADAYRALGSSVRRLSSDAHPRVLLLTSPEPGGGTTTTVANLGVVLAEAGDRVLIMSTDFRSRALNRLFDLPDEPGLSDVLSDQADLRSLIRPTSVPGLSVVPSGNAPDNPSLLGGPKMGEILDSLRREDLDIILIDSSAALATADVSLLGARVDGTILVCDARHVDASTLERSRRRLEMSGSKIAAAVFTFGPQDAKTYPSVVLDGHLARS
jgi:polysaccharide biosynthesis transport protein